MLVRSFLDSVIWFDLMLSGLAGFDPDANQAQGRSRLVFSNYLVAILKELRQGILWYT